MAEHTDDHFEQLGGLGPETSNSERVRRMKRLLRQLYKDEFSGSRLRLPPFKVKGLVVSLSLLSIVIFGVTTLYNFNIFITFEEKILSAKGHIQDALQRRANLFTNLINLTLNQAALEQEVFRHVADVRAAMAGQERGRKDGGVAGDKQPGAGDSKPGESAGAATRAQGLAAALSGMEGASSMAKLMAVVEQYPEIKSSTTYQQLMDKLVEIEDRIISRRDGYNEDVRVYNTLITSFPWYILAHITGFKRYEYFTMDSMNQSDKQVLSNLSSMEFQRLLPLAPGQKQDANRKELPVQQGDGKLPANKESAP
ncbi:MAG: LemA family protein [Magnetococcales bacterium]|nr:LemA family protein [Magnetococcales bacterium]